MSATRATRTSSSVSLLIYLYRNSFWPCTPLPHSPLPHQNPQSRDVLVLWTSSLFSSFFCWQAYSFDAGCLAGVTGVQEIEERASQRRHQYYCHKFHICSFRCRLKFRSLRGPSIARTKYIHTYVYNI